MADSANLCGGDISAYGRTSRRRTVSPAFGPPKSPKIDPPEASKMLDQHVRSRPRSRRNCSPRRKSPARHRRCPISPTSVPALHWSPRRESPARLCRDSRSPERTSRPRHRSESRSRRELSPCYGRRHQNYTSPERELSPPCRALTLEQSKPVVVPSKRLSGHRKSSDYRRKMVRYDDDDEEQRRLKSPQERMRKAFDPHGSLKSKQQQKPEPPKIDVLQHKPVLSFDNQSEGDFMDLDELIASEASRTCQSAVKDTSTKVRKLVIWDTWDEPDLAPGASSLPSPDYYNDCSVVEGIHPSRSQRMSDDPDTDDVADNSTSNEERTPVPFAATGMNANELGVRRSSKDPGQRQTASLSSLKAPMPIGSAFTNKHGPPVLPRPISPAQYDDIWETGNETAPVHHEHPWGSAIPPPPLTAAPSLNRIAASTLAPAGAGPPRTRQKIFDDYCEAKDQVIKEDDERRAANGTVAYEISEEEVEIMLARMNFNPGKVALATKQWHAKDGEPFLKHKEDMRSIPTVKRMNERGFPLTVYDEEKTTFQTIEKLGRETIKLLVKTTPGPAPILTKFDKELRRKEHERQALENNMQKEKEKHKKRKHVQKMDTMQKEYQEKPGRGKGKENVMRSSEVPSSGEEAADVAASAAIAGLIGVDMEL